MAVAVVTRTLAPSSSSTWSGTPAPAGPYTREQEEGIRKRPAGRGWNGERYDVRLRVSSKAPGDWAATHDVRAFPCPLLRTTKTGRLVITPSGQEKWINREGLNK